MQYKVPYVFISLLFVVMSCCNCASEPMPVIVSETNQFAFNNEATSGENVTVDSDFSGGNIIVERIEGDNIYLKPDLRDTRSRVDERRRHVAAIGFLGMSGVGCYNSCVTAVRRRRNRYADTEIVP